MNGMLSIKRSVWHSAIFGTQFWTGKLLVHKLTPCISRLRIGDKLEGHLEKSCYEVRQRGCRKVCFCSICYFQIWLRFQSVLKVKCLESLIYEKLVIFCVHFVFKKALEKCVKMTHITLLDQNIFFFQKLNAIMIPELVLKLPKVLIIIGSLRFHLKFMCVWLSKQIKITQN